MRYLQPAFKNLQHIAVKDGHSSVASAIAHPAVRWVASKRESMRVLECNEV